MSHFILMNFEFADYTIPLIIMAGIGIAAFVLSLFVLRKLFHRFMPEDEYKKFKRGWANIIIPLLLP
jgi:hypothetical protein